MNFSRKLKRLRKLAEAELDECRRSYGPETNVSKFSCLLNDNALRIENLLRAAEKVAWYEWTDVDEDADQAMQKLKLAVDDINAVNR